MKEIKIPDKTRYWLIRPGINGLCFEQFRKDNVVAIGWDRIAKLDKNDEVLSLDEVKNLVSQVYKDLLSQKKSLREQRRKTSDIANKIYKFTYEIQIGDIIVCPGEDSVLVGQIEGNVEIVKGLYNSSKNINSDTYIGELNKVRHVKWIKEIKKTQLEPNIKLELRVVHGLSEICNNQVITEINRSLYSLYSYKNLMHSVYRIKDESQIDFEKYANFISCVYKVYLKLKQNDDSLYIKTNINSPGPIEFLGKTKVVFNLTHFVELILKKQDIPNDVEEKEWIKQMQEEHAGYNYDDYIFPSGGQV